MKKLLQTIKTFLCSDKKLSVEKNVEIIKAVFHFGPDYHQLVITFEPALQYSKFFQTVMGSNADDMFEDFMRDAREIGIFYANKECCIPFHKLQNITLSRTKHTFTIPII